MLQTKPIPKASAMVICDLVITEQETNKKSLIGIFESVNAESFPCIHHFMSVYIKMTDANGTYKFHLDLVDLKTDGVIAKGEIPHEIKIDNPLSSHELVFNLKGLRFMHPGEYEFRIYANDRIFGQKTFIVRPIDTEASGDSSST
jgi:hypothetical protein